MRTFCGLTTDGMLEYLAAIYKLGGRRGRASDKVTTSALAEKMHVSPAAVSSMLKRLEESGFVDRSNSEGITLTEQGELAALQLIRRHRLLEVFLVKVMGYTWDQVDAEAHRLQHAISSAFEDRMDELCGYPTHCPHGDPIPRKDGAMPDEHLVPLTELQPGQQAVLWRIGNTDARVLRYLSQLKLEPGRIVKFIEAAPFNGPVTIEVCEMNGDEERVRQVLGSELAAQLFVVIEPPAEPVQWEAVRDGAQAI
ncbi:MAG: metal-dependent transcriptional regulator [Caldilinea sp.]|nr:metal-dependent transcriptional regulator [Caldilinea sp.]MDW8442092.1 metal-dependent transcriptional regulator [Caldilineaceae bacterium]